MRCDERLELKVRAAARWPLRAQGPRPCRVYYICRSGRGCQVVGRTVARPEPKRERDAEIAYIYGLYRYVRNYSCTYLSSVHPASSQWTLPRIPVELVWSYSPSLRESRPAMLQRACVTTLANEQRGSWYGNKVKEGEPKYGRNTSANRLVKVAELPVSDIVSLTVY